MVMCSPVIKFKRNDVSFHLIPALYDSNLLSEFILSLLLITENRIVRLIHPPSALLTRPWSVPNVQPNRISKPSSPSSTSTLKFDHGIGSLLSRALWDRNAEKIFRQTKVQVQSIRVPQYGPKNLTPDSELRDRQNMTTQTGRKPLIKRENGSAIIGVCRRLQSFGCAILVADCDLRDGMDFLFNIHRVQSVAELISQSDWLIIIKGYGCSIEDPISHGSSVYDSQKVGHRLTDGLLDYVKSGSAIIGVYRRLQSFGCAILVADCDLRDGMDFLFNIHRVQSVAELISQSDWLIIIKGYGCSIEDPISHGSSVYDSQKVGHRLTDGLLDYVKSGEHLKCSRLNHPDRAEMET
ncbi:hypothetical protein AHF37_04366 [Paragonimus kellicotti]|nr:hypothetical protein AHF37_04366 [Paragonimus kellicotti]